MSCAKESIFAAQQLKHSAEKDLFCISKSYRLGWCITFGEEALHAVWQAFASIVWDVLAMIFDREWVLCQQLTQNHYSCEERLRTKKICSGTRPLWSEKALHQGIRYVAAKRATHFWKKRIGKRQKFKKWFRFTWKKKLQKHDVMRGYSNAAVPNVCERL